VIFTALDPRNLPTEHLLREYLTYAADCLEPDDPRPDPNAGTTYSRALASALRSHGGYTTWLDYPVAGLKIDVVAQHGAQALAIAADGDPEASATPDSGSLERVGAEAILERAGWRVYRLPYRRWQREREECLAEIDALLGGGGGEDEETDATSA
jgi:restriction endonuclease-like protein